MLFSVGFWIIRKYNGFIISENQPKANCHQSQMSIPALTTLRILERAPSGVVSVCQLIIGVSFTFAVFLIFFLVHISIHFTERSNRRKPQKGRKCRKRSPAGVVWSSRIIPRTYVRLSVSASFCYLLNHSWSNSQVIQNHLFQTIFFRLLKDTWCQFCVLLFKQKAIIILSFASRLLIFSPHLKMSFSTFEFLETVAFV